MKKFLSTLIFVSMFYLAHANLIISGSLDGPLPGGTKVVEIYVINDVPDLSVYGLGFANNGGGTDGLEYVFPAVSATAGEYIYFTNDSTNFANYLGFNADYVSGSIGAFNGNDAIELYEYTEIIDIFGNPSGDATSEGWNYQDSWVYRVDGTGPDDTTFVPANWIIQPTDFLDTTTMNSQANPPYPYGTYVPGAAGCTDIFYVDASATGSNDGSDWTNAFTDLQLAIAEVDTCPAVIRMAEGTYYPTSGTSRGATFDLTSNLTITGGYPAGGGDIDPVLNETILSGNVDGVGSAAGNSYHVVRAQNVSGVVLDGLTIRDGNADDAVSFGRSRGGGIYSVGSSIILNKCEVKWNRAIFGGGIFATLSPEVMIRYSTFKNNTATNGSAMYHSNETNMFLRYSRVENNNATGRCALEVNNSLYTSIENSVIANNTAANANAIALIATNRNQTFDLINSTVIGGAKDRSLFSMQVGFKDTLNVDVSNSIIAHQNTSWDKNVVVFNNQQLNFNATNSYFSGAAFTNLNGVGTNNIVESAVLFEDMGGDLLLNADFSVDPCSPVVNAGNNSIASGFSTDIAGNPRYFGSVDMGAYEAQSSCVIAREIADNETLGLNSNVNVFPNPVVDVLSIRTDLENVTVQVFNMQGQRLMTTNQMDVDMSQLPKGMYLVSVFEDGELLWTKKVMK